MSANNEPTRAPLRMFGLSHEARQQGAPLNVTSETTAWEIYNNRASVIDRELIKDWNDSLNSLIIFAALYSAVLTAFIIESMKLLEEDPTETTRDILLAVTRQLANASAEAYEPTSFVADKFAVRVNAFFFFSISASLIAALGAVLALQWVGSYDAGLHPSSAEERALQRHFRHQGVEDWKMAEIIATLPTLIFLALLLFFIGLADWMWHVHYGIAAVIIMGLILGVSFFVVTTVISMVYVGAPFRTPTSRSIPFFLHRCYRFLIHLPTAVMRIPFKELLNRVNETSKRFYTTASSWQTMKHPKASFGKLLAAMKPSKKTLSFNLREEAALDAVPDIKRASLLWLARTTDVLPYSKETFLVLIQEFLTLPPHQLVDSTANDAPWNDIFTLLCKDYFGRKSRDEFNADELEAVSFLLRGIATIGKGYCATPVFNRFFAAIGDGYSDYAANCADVARWKHWHELKSSFVKTQFELAEANTLEICDHIYDRPLHLIQTTFLSFSLLFNHSLRVHRVYDRLALQLTGDVATFLPGAKLFPLNALDTIIYAASCHYACISKEESTGSTSLDRYLSLLQKKPDINGPTGHGYVFSLHTAVQAQFLAHLFQNDGTDEISVTNLLKSLTKLFREAFSADIHSPLVRLGFMAILESNVDVWDTPYRQLTANFVSALVSIESYEVTNDWEVWWTEVLEGLDLLIHAPWPRGVNVDYFLSDFATHIVSHNLGLFTPRQDLLARREAVRHPSLSLLASLDSPNSGGFMFLRLDKDWRNISWNKIVTLWCSYRREIPSKDLYFICEVLDKGPQDALEDCLEILRMYIVRSPASVDWAIVIDAFFTLIRANGSLMPIGDITRVLCLLSVHSSFASKFVQSRTYIWTPDYDSEMQRWIHFVRTSMAIHLGHASSGEDLCQRMYDVYTYFTLTENNHQMFDSSLSITIRALQYTLQRQGKQGQRTSAEAIRVSTASTPDLYKEEYIPKSFHALDHQYVEEWTTEQWDDWKSVVNVVIIGFTRGRIMVGPSIETTRFCRDPDGLCAR